MTRTTPSGNVSCRSTNRKNRMGGKTALEGADPSAWGAP
jgi:hypothetical protein